jgi:hypothetical protein
MVRPSMKDPRMPFPRLTWAGLLVATLGWGLLLSYPLWTPQGAGAADNIELRDSARFLLVFGENAIMTGLAMALLGAAEKAIHLLARQPVNGGQTKTAPPMRAASPQLMSARPPTEIVARGEVGGRDYVLFRDGSVVIETLLGPRRFLSLSEAQQFIGTN